MPEPLHDYDNSLTGRFTKPEAKIEMVYTLLRDVHHFYFYFSTGFVLNFHLKHLLEKYAKSADTKKNNY